MDMDLIPITELPERGRVGGRSFVDRLLAIPSGYVAFFPAVDHRTQANIRRRAVEAGLTGRRFHTRRGERAGTSGLFVWWEDRT